MSTPTNVRRCGILMAEPRQEIAFDLDSLLRGGSALLRINRWTALAPHLDTEVALTNAEMAVLSGLDENAWYPWPELLEQHPAEVLSSLLEKAVLLGDHAAHRQWLARDESLRAQHWHPATAVAHYFTRSEHAGAGEDVLVTRNRTMPQLIAEHGPPPPHVLDRCAAPDRLPLPPPGRTALDDVLSRRATCRNFDRSATLALEQLSTLLQRVAGLHAEVEMAPGAMMLKKSHPSGGGLHPTECYLLLRSVQGVDPGLYHYHAGEHALEPLRTLPQEEADALAQSFVAGQYFFADCQVLVALVPRFLRTHWKYRRHPKAYRALVLEVGHMAQNLYIAATEAGFGAWVTVAINEKLIERAFGLDSTTESPIAMCGFGIRAAERNLIEFDPLHRVWPASDEDPPVHRVR